MKSFLALGISILLISCTSDTNYSLSVNDLEAQLSALSQIEDETQRLARTSEIWDSLTANNLIPFTQDSSVLFLYRGEANSVHWNGDFTSWGNDQRFRNEGVQVEGTDIWMLKQSFPPDSRLDYKITLDESEWILDPNNPLQQWSGFGPNSVLGMPDWSSEPLKVRIPEAQKGSFSEDILISSSMLGYDINYNVYTPHGYENLSELPVIYITDGQEYSDDKLGSSLIVLDNLIHLKKIEPIVAVFVNPIDPENEANNKRADEMAVNEDYLAFFVDELIPEIENNYTVNTSRESRAILGTSLGGLNSTFFGFSRPDIFGNIAIQAPAFWYREEIYEVVRNSNVESPNIYMSVGTIGDNTNDARRMKKLFEEMELDFSYLEVNEGHSWGAWSAQMDDILLQFYGN